MNVKKYKNWMIVFIILGSCMILYSIFSGRKESYGKEQILIAAAASMQNVMEEVEKVYEQENPEVDITFTYGGSGTLQNQIEQGAPIDVFIAASTSPMRKLEKKGLIENAFELVKNTIVLIVPEDSTYETLTFETCHEVIETIAIGEPESVPAGSYAKEVFETIGTYDQILEKATLGLDVTQVLSWVQAGNVDAGVVYQTDFNSAEGVKRMDGAEELLSTPIIYPIGITTGSKAKETAEGFVTFCLSDTGQSLFEEYGFIRKDQ